ncbi:MAG: PQQ-binding-like beta-propeller repeat protein [Gemmataceae bacterium]
MCVSTAGKEVWKKDLGSAAVPKTFGNEGNGASATPSTDGKHVYCFGGDGTLAAFDLDGKEAWRFNVQQRTASSTFSSASTRHRSCSATGSTSS